MTWQSHLLEILAASLVRPVLLAAGVALLLRIFRVSHPASKHLVWTAVLVGTLLIPFANVWAPHVELPALPQGVWRSPAVAAASTPTKDTVHFESATTVTQQSPLRQHSASAPAVAVPVNTAVVNNAPPAATVRSIASVPYQSILTWGYLTGFMIALGYRIAGALMLRRLLSKSRPLRMPMLCDCDDVTVPFATGILRPRIILPFNWREWSAKTRRSILAHEIAHIRRRDMWVLALSQAIKCLLWFHPLVWWLTRKVAELSEMACDAAALRTAADPSEYARILLDFSRQVQQRGQRAALPGLSMVGHSPLSRRVEQVLAFRTNLRRLRRPAIVLSLVGVPAVYAASSMELTEVVTRPLVATQKFVAGKLEEVLPVSFPREPFSILSAALLGQQTPLSAPKAPTIEPREFLNQYCVECHNSRARVANLVLENRALSQIRTDAQVWEKVARRMSGLLLHHFSSTAKPDKTALLAFADWLDGELDRNASAYTPAPGPHRLNRTEYANAIRDLFSLEINPALLLPSDDSTHGFDNIASALNVITLEQYRDAADKVTDLVMSSAGRRQVFVCHPIWNDPLAVAQEPGCVRRIIETLATRAYRRPLTPDDMGSLLAAYESNHKSNVVVPDKSYFDEWGFENGIEGVVRAILSDQSFLYRTEVEPTNVPSGQTYRISDLDLASRLSFFLWSTGPDSQLMDLAARGQLRNPIILERETRRMLKDPRSEALAANFGAQWLWLRRLDNIDPISTYADFDEPLRQAMRREMDLFFSSIVQEDRSVIDLLDANYTFVNERLARHYGMRNITGSEFRRVTLTPEFDVRRGVLGKGALLAVSSQRDRTSITNRGKVVLQALQGVSPPDPPPNILPIPRQTNKTLRKMMEEANSESPSCVSCHSLFDPLGIALENFDLAGKWRTTDVGQPIDPVTELLDGTRLAGPGDLRNALIANSDQFVRTMTEKMLTYALGRGLSYQDMPQVRALVRDSARENHRFSAIVLGIVKSTPFQMNTKK